MTELDMEIQKLRRENAELRDKISEYQYALHWVRSRLEETEAVNDSLRKAVEGYKAKQI